MKKSLVLVALAFALFATAPLHAQLGGCTGSPENPTLVLAGLASGAFGVSQLRMRMIARRAKKQQ